MGLKLNYAKLVFEAHASGVRFDRTVTLGRQFFNGSPQIFERLKSLYGFEENSFSIIPTQQAYAEPFFRMLGAKEILAIDVSDYESANIIHDMNCPIASEWHQQFDCVFDTGSLEHIFNFPIAIKNCMDMTKVGGHLLLFFPANNFYGHGFYQFSAELFASTVEKNGFRVERTIAFEDVETPKYFNIANPKAPIMNKPITRYPVVMMILATKQHHAESCLAIPQQAAYEMTWNMGSSTPKARPNQMVAKFRRHVRELFPAFANELSPNLGDGGGQAAAV